MTEVDQIQTCEMIIQHIWSDVLIINPITVDSDFFECGGHSLTALTITNRLESLLGIAIPLRMIFDNPRLSDYATAVVELLREESLFTEQQMY